MTLTVMCSMVSMCLSILNTGICVWAVACMMGEELCRRLNLRAILAGGRIPGYKDHAAKMTPEEYIEAVKVKACFDPILTFQLNNEFDVNR